MPTVTVDYYGVEGAGRNVTEAKRVAGEKIRKSLDGSYSPEVVAWRGFAMLIWREPSGWSSRIIASPDNGIPQIETGKLYGGANEESHTYAKRAALRHLAQLGWNHDDGDDPPEFLTDLRDKAEFRSWVTFQRKYKRARAAGLNDHEAHSWACGSLGRPDLEERMNNS